MSRDIWIEVLQSAEAASGYFETVPEVLGRISRSVDEEDDFGRYVAEQGLLKIMENGYTEIERSLERVLGITGETIGPGPSYHKDLLRRASMPMDGRRPAILEGPIVDAVDEARKFRHVARKQYDDFRMDSFEEPRKAAAILADEFVSNIESFVERCDAYWASLDTSEPDDEPKSRKDEPS